MSDLARLSTALGGRYTLVRELGAGGMATVYLAHDPKHDREVAVKVLRQDLAAVLGAERFLNEIRISARLDHPHILTLIDSGSAGGFLYYVLPYVRGESLREKLQRERQLSVEQALAIARQVAGALDYAHRQGIVHRDIKPENILLLEGEAMLTDFGIALAVRQAGGSRLTEAGLSLGTPQYMSPEQVTGEVTLDGRSDIYSLAAVLYEMLAGEPPYTGPNAQAIIAAVIAGKARPIDEHRRTVPDHAAATIHRALQPLPADRFATAAEFAEALDRGPRGWTPPRRRSAARTTAALALAALAGLGVGLALRRASPGPAAAVRRWSIDLPANAPLALAGPSVTDGWPTAIALAPAGDRIAYVAPRGGTTVLAVRPLDGDSVSIVPGTEGAYHPFYSPDGKWIGFFAGDLLRKVPASGGQPVTLAEVNRITGAMWGDDDRIYVIERAGFELHRIAASGSREDSTIKLDTQFGTPDLLPGGAWAVGQLSSGQLALLELATGREMAVTRRGVLPFESMQAADLLFAASPHWMASGWLVYAAGDGVLSALPFDAKARKVLGQSVPLFTGVRMEAGFGYADFDLARDGTLIFVPGRNQLYSIFAFIRGNGRYDTLPFPRGQYVQPRISPDGTQLAAQQRDPAGRWDVLLMNLATGVRHSIAVEGNYRGFPASWLPSGKELMIGLWDPVQFLNYGARVQSLETGKWWDLKLRNASYMTVSPDGRQFVFSDWKNSDLFLRPLSETDTVRTPIKAKGFAASFSPDGRWVAWGGVGGEVAVSPDPPTGAIYPVAERGVQPVWTPKGDAIVYRDGTKYWRVPVSTRDGFHAGRAELLADGPFLSAFAWNHAMAPDGRLLVLLGDPQTEAGSLGVVTGFPAFVARAASAGAR